MAEVVARHASDRRELEGVGATGGLPASVRVPIGDRHTRAGKLPVAPRNLTQLHRLLGG